MPETAPSSPNVRRRPLEAEGLPLLLTVAEAAHQLGVSVRKVWMMRDDGELEFVTVGVRSHRVTSESVRNAWRPYRKPQAKITEPA